MHPARKNNDLRSFDVSIERIVTRATAHLDSLARIVGVERASAELAASGSSRSDGFPMVECKPRLGLASPPRMRASTDQADAASAVPHSTPVHPGCFSWHEFHTSNARESAIFLADLLEAEVRTRALGGVDEYSTILGNGLHIAGGCATAQREPSRWSAYLRVPNVDVLCERAIDAGGSVRVAPSGIEGLDRRAEICDPTGARVTVIAGGDDRRTTGTGAFGWDELRSTDLMESVRFWCATLGWSAQPALGSSGGECIVFLNGGAPVASATHALSIETSSRWLPIATFRRKSVELVVREALAHGGSLRVAPQAHAILGISAVVVDARGLEVGIGGEVHAR
ncbi:MAG: hypothetical protein QM516_12300 [Limnohabitans sp.]|jgi:predicted enzyme related to lactoylglutathione lyase|nr:hypothetical protein [Limnohabitans sp.]